MRQKYLLTAICLLLAVAARAYVTTWPLYGEVFVEDIALADDNSTIVNNIGDCYYDYQYCPALHIAALRHIYPSNASGERDFVLVPTYIIVDGVAYHVVGVSGQLLGDDANTIKNIYLHNELEFLGSRALYNATAVSSITIPASVRSIAYDVFNGLGTTSAIRTLTFADGNEPLAIEGAYSNGRMIIANLPLHTLHLGRTFAGNSYGTTSGSTLQQTLVNLTVGGEGTEVSPGTFKEFPNLTNVTFNAGVASIGANAFEKCPKLESVTMSAVARIGDYAFASDSLITSLSLGEGVRYIGDYAFNDCKRVSSLTLPASLDSVHVRAFVGMAGVQTLTIADTDSPLQLFGVPSGINVHESMLSHLTALESANMGRNLLPTTYGNSLSAFHKAHMSTLTLGKLVSNLNANEFKGCSNLAIINSLTPTPPACADATTFDSVDKTACALHVPLGCKGAYQAAPVWEAFFSVTDDLPNDNPTVRGDINGDNTVDVGDVNMIINITLGKANPVSAADINGDGTVDVTDVNMIINITLGKL